MQELLIYAVSVLVGMVVLYHIIKSAVKSAILETRQEQTIITSPAKPEKPTSTAHELLKQKYENGLITFEEYQNEWGKLG